MNKEDCFSKTQENAFMIEKKEKWSNKFLSKSLYKAKQKKK